mgnify:CR=1 FL=1
MTPGGDTRRNDLQRQLMGHEYGILASRWGFDPMLRESADRAGAVATRTGEGSRLRRVGMVEARLNDGRLLFDFSKPVVCELFAQMQRVHYIKRFEQGKGEVYTYARIDDDLAAALEDAIEVIDGGLSVDLPRPRSDVPRRRSPGRVREWLKV